ncbi:MAG: hypothetical protein GOU99_03825, partial [Candidatus Altiarchaeota archaeon]|nr:hypothetical protein [Candidatus Altiarchaeota archaeon]
MRNQALVFVLLVAAFAYTVNLDLTSSGAVLIPHAGYAVLNYTIPYSSFSDGEGLWTAHYKMNVSTSQAGETKNVIVYAQLNCTGPRGYDSSAAEKV